MTTVSVSSWSEFEIELRQLGRRRLQREAETGRRFNEFLYRGLASGRWGLETTLERAFPAERSSESLRVDDYYQEVYSSKPGIETLSGEKWDLPIPPDFQRMLKGRRPADMRLLFNDNQALYEYLVYIRHRGFPSPLLDWTSSPYLAAFFAFDDVPKDADTVAVFALLLDTIRAFSSGEPYVTILGPYVRAHPRHYIQQSQYTISVNLDDETPVFSPHQNAIDSAVGVGGELLKIVIPASSRLDALRNLDQMNINKYSVYGTDDAMVQTIARRQCLL